MIRQLLASLILVMAFCSIKTESWASKRTSPGSILSPCILSRKLRSWLAEYFFPESKRKWSLSFLKKSWNPSCTQSTIKSLNLESSSKFSSRSWRKSCHIRNQSKGATQTQLTWNLVPVDSDFIASFCPLDSRIPCDIGSKFLSSWVIFQVVVLA